MITLTTPSAGTLHARAHRSMHAFIVHSLKPYNVTPTGWAALGIIAATMSTRPSTIADELGVKRPVVTQLIHEYEKRGFITSAVDPHDTRAKRITLTPHGVAFAELLETKLRADMHGFLKDVAVEDLTTYFHVLRIIANKAAETN